MHALSTPNVWVVLDEEDGVVGTCVTEESAHQFANFMNRRGKFQGLRVIEYEPVHRVGTAEEG